jgi:hypothetical protein
MRDKNKSNQKTNKEMKLEIDHLNRQIPPEAHPPM